MTDDEIISTVDGIIKKMTKLFREDVDPQLRDISRQDYLAQHPEITDKRNFNFSLSGEYIYNNRIPTRVAGCTGRAKVFTYLASQTNILDYVRVIPTVKISDIKSDKTVNGHQIIGIQLSDGLHLIDPGRGSKTFKNSEIKINGPFAIGMVIDAEKPGKFDYAVTANLSPDEYDKIDTYEKLKKVYLNRQILKRYEYEGAMADIHQKVWDSIQKQIPTLDYIMDVAHMSKTDKVFYEAYKKYGNRNHTWQDFKEMFDGDVKEMQKTVKQWNTWNEINSVATAAEDKIAEKEKTVRQLLRKYKLKNITKELCAQYKDKYPDLVAAFQEILAINDTIPKENYATFDVDISKLEKEFKLERDKTPAGDTQAYKKLMVKYIDKMYELVDAKNRDFVVGERIETYREIIHNDPEILFMAQKFQDLSGTEKIDLARMILNASAKKFGVPTGTIIQDDAPDGPHELKAAQAGAYNNILRRFLFLPDNTFKTLSSFLSILAHEDAHRIDYFSPNMGMIGEQIMEWARDNYLNDLQIGYTEYTKQPSEESSYYLQNTVAAAVEYGVRQSKE